MSGVEEVVSSDEGGTVLETEAGGKNNEESTKKLSSSDSGNWTVLDKEEIDASKEDTPSVPSDKLLSNETSTIEDDSESIETISEDEGLASSSGMKDSIHVSLSSFCCITDVDDSGFAVSEPITLESIQSTLSDNSLASDGIPIVDINSQPPEVDAQPQYEWNSMAGEASGLDGSQVELPPEEEEKDKEEENEDEVGEGEGEEDEVLSSGNEEELEEENINRRVREDSEPGYDHDDDGLPGAPLPPLEQEVDLYPSQELDESFQAIEPGKVYRHEHNIPLDQILTALLVLALALVVGLGIGHFLGLSERLEVQEMYELLQEEKMDILQDDLVTCIQGEEGKGGDDQDLDDRVIKQLWNENQELKDQVQAMKAGVGGQPGDEAMSAILRDKINELLTANADLQREVARLRYADAAREAAESVATLDKLRKTRDTLNDIVTENDQLKIEVGKARYGEPIASSEKELLMQENENLRAQLESLQMLVDEGVNPQSFIDNKITQDENNTNAIIQDDLSTPWPSKRHEELRIDDENLADFSVAEDHSEVDETDIKDENIVYNEKLDENGDFSTVMFSLSGKLEQLLKTSGNKIISRNGNIDWDLASRFVHDVEESVRNNIKDASLFARSNIEALVERFEEMKSKAVSEGDRMDSVAKTATVKMMKTLLGAVDDLSDASEDAAEAWDWKEIFESETAKMKTSFETKWSSIQTKLNSMLQESMGNEEDKINNHHKRKQSMQNVESNAQREKQKKRNINSDDEGYFSSEEREPIARSKNRDKANMMPRDSSHKKSNQIHSSIKNERKQSEDIRSNSRKSRDEAKTDNGQKRRGEGNGKYRRVHDKENGAYKRKADWSEKRGEERERQRQKETNSDWLFERAKHRREISDGEQRSDWYFERKKIGEKTYAEQRRNFCGSDMDEDCESFTSNDRQRGRNNDKSHKKYKKSRDEKRNHDFDDKDELMKSFDKLDARMNDFIHL